MVEAFERFAPGMTTEEPTPEFFLQGSTALVQWCRTENSTFVIDSFLPGFWYLYGRYSDEQIAAFSTELRSILNPLQPLVLYLRTDVEAALMRAARQRGMQWLENITRYLNGWQLPLFGGALKPLRTTSDVISFFARADRLAIALLAEWPGALILDATQTSVSQLLATILSYLELAERSIEHREAPADLQRYTGIYIPYERGQAGQSLEISLMSDELFVNTYWPAGTRLLPEGGGRFHLEGTNRHIAFDVQANGSPCGLTYYYGETTHRYKKRA